MPKGIIKTDEEISQLTPEQQVRRKRDSLRICAMDAQKRADAWVEKAAADPGDTLKNAMIMRSQVKADEAMARYRAFAAKHPPQPRKRKPAPVPDNSFNVAELIANANATPEAKPKRKRKPLTEAQRLARNEKARQRRAAKKAEATA